MRDILRFVKSNKLAILIFLSALALRVSFLSFWLEDWDSVQFSIALHDYDLGKNQPHAPGYPLYILLGKFFYFFTRSDIASLNFLSALAGSLAIFFLYLIAKNIFDKQVAIIASLLFMLAPISLMMSISPLTNMIGLCSLLGFIYILRTKFDQYPLHVATLAGFILGFRATEFPIIALLLTFAIIKHNKIRHIISIGFYFLLGIFLWMIPMIIVTGVDSFLSSYKWIAQYVLNHDSTLSQNLGDRLTKIAFLTKTSFTAPFIIFSIISGLFAVRIKNLKEEKWQFILLWFLAYLIPFIFIYNLEVPRYTLPLLPPMAITTAFFVSMIIKKASFLGYLVTTILLLTLTSQSFSQAHRFQNTIPPSIAPVLFVKNNFNPKDTFIVASYTYRQFEYYAPEFKSVYEISVDKNTLGQTKYVIIDYKGLTNKLATEVNYKEIRRMDFSGDRDIYSRLPNVSLYVLELNNDKEN